MLSEIVDKGQCYYGFSYPRANTELPFILINCGSDLQRKKSYSWDGMSRGMQSRIIWQYTLSGFGRLESKGQSFDIHPGACFMVLLPSKHRYFMPPGSPEWGFAYLTMGGTGAQQLVEQILETNGPVISFAEDSKTLRTFKSIFKMSEKGAINNQMENSLQAYAFLMSMLFDLEQMRGTQSGLPGYIKDVMDFCGKHLPEPISVEDMASVAHLTRYHFSREFKRLMKVSPGLFLRRLRREKARKLLRETKQTIKEIAFLCGFQSCNYFCDAFQKEYGLSPGKFRSADPIYDEIKNF